MPLLVVSTDSFSIELSKQPTVFSDFAGSTKALTDKNVLAGCCEVEQYSLNRIGMGAENLWSEVDQLKAESKN